jgi:hypothetical protein
MDLLDPSGMPRTMVGRPSAVSQQKSPSLIFRHLELFDHSPSKARNSITIFGFSNTPFFPLSIIYYLIASSSLLMQLMIPTRWVVRPVTEIS